MLIAEVFRAHYLTPVTTYSSLTGRWQPASGSWILGSGLVDKAGHAISMNPNGVAEGVPVSALSGACQKLIPALHNGASLVQDGVITRGLDDSRLAACVQAAGLLRQFFTYQPVSRYWAFQSIETVIFLALAAALVAIAFAAVTRHDA